MEPLVFWLLVFISPMAGPTPQGVVFFTDEACETNKAEIAAISVLISKCERVALRVPGEEA